MVDRKNAVQNHGSKNRHQQGRDVQREKSDAEDDQIQGELDIACAPAEPVLQIVGEDADATEAGLVAEYNQHPKPDKHPAGDGSEGRVYGLNIDEVIDVFREHRNQQHTDDGVDRKTGAEFFERQDIKGQVQNRKQGAETKGREFCEQQGKPREAAGDQPHFAQHRHAKRDQHHGAGEGEGVLMQGVAFLDQGSNSPFWDDGV